MPESTRSAHGGRAGARVGIGYDSHRLVEPGPLLLGGVTVPYQRGLAGHSDADALAHAVIDALLGAAGLGNIGKLFPDTDEQWRGADSMRLLAEAWRHVTAGGWRLGNLDATIITEAPRLGPYLDQMAEGIAARIGARAEQVNVKAKTNEGMGFLGRGEGIAVLAMAALEAS
jgi:2-C-methyl-D-erythritol 2,4-cyclodiphosphate synthase